MTSYHKRRYTGAHRFAAFTILRLTAIQLLAGVYSCILRGQIRHANSNIAFYLWFIRETNSRAKSGRTVLSKKCGI